MTNRNTPSTQTIKRGKHSREYLIISNELAQNKTLSYEARGLLVELLSRPDDWEASVAQLQIPGTAGREKVRRILAELIAAGYVEDKQRVRSEDGSFYYTPYIVHESPLTRNPLTADPSTANPPLQNTYIQNTDDKGNTGVLLAEETNNETIESIEKKPVPHAKTTRKKSRARVIDRKAAAETSVSPAPEAGNPPPAESKSSSRVNLHDEIITPLLAEFSAATGIESPPLETGRDWGAFKVRWERPLRSIFHQSLSDIDMAKDIIAEAVKAMRLDHLTIAAPQSIEKTAISIAALHKQAAQGPSRNRLPVPKVPVFTEYGQAGFRDMTPPEYEHWRKLAIEAGYEVQDG